MDSELLLSLHRLSGPDLGKAQDDSGFCQDGIRPEGIGGFLQGGEVLSGHLDIDLDGALGV